MSNHSKEEEKWELNWANSAEWQWWWRWLANGKRKSSISFCSHRCLLKSSGAPNSSAFYWGNFLTWLNLNASIRILLNQDCAKILNYLKSKSRSNVWRISSVNGPRIENWQQKESFEEKTHSIRLNAWSVLWMCHKCSVCNVHWIKINERIEVCMRHKTDICFPFVYTRDGKQLIIMHIDVVRM